MCLFSVVYKMLLEKGSTASWENKGLISRLYNCTAIDRFGYANYMYLQSTSRCAFVETTLVFVSH